MKVFPRILALYAGDYRRQSYGALFLWLLFFTGVLVFALVCIARLDFQDVYAVKGQVIRVEQEQKEIRVEIPPSRASQIKPGNTVMVLDNEQQLIESLISKVEAFKVNTLQAKASAVKAQTSRPGPSLVAYINCSNCRLVFSQEVELHIISQKSSVFEMFKNRFIKE